ncbi:Papilin [Trichinella pseudospiralis]|uniref:Papilin n=1 Tax=Trichinella pseudospiralis TaxID=6337 RepID=A0A0V1FSH3_TRIPS|nr:Papilin [Trichinella pseudospiralis]
MMRIMTISLNECCLDNERKNVQSSSVPSSGHALFTFKCIGKINTNDGDRPSSSAIGGQQRLRYLSASTHTHTHTTGQGGQVVQDRDPAALSSSPLVALEVSEHFHFVFLLLVFLSNNAGVTSNSNDSDAGLPVFLSIIRRTSVKPVTEAVINDAAHDQSTEENVTADQAEPDSVDNDDASNEAKVITVKIYPPDVDLNSVREASFSVDIPNPFGFGDVVTHLPTTTASDKQVLQIDTHLKIVDYSLLCRDGAPQLSDGKPLHCFSDADCMVGYWCHIGSSRITTYCCPNALADYGCNLPRLSGHGTGRMERWYHDVKLGGCQKFFYTGYGGNQNNFLTKDQCLPLSTGQGYNLDVRWAYDQTADQCRTFLFFGFGGNANNFETEMECMAACSSQRYQFPDVLLSNQLIAGEQQYGFLQPDIRHQPISQQSILVCNGLKKINEVELCDQHNNYQCPDAADHHQLDHYPSECFLPLDLGQGSRPLVRWYFDQISGRCQEFLYRGSNGNMNNFESSDECRAFCERRTCANGTPLRQQSGRVLLCSGSSTASNCPPTHFCHVGHDRLSTVCCPREVELPGACFCFSTEQYIEPSCYTLYQTLKNICYGDTCSLPVNNGIGQNRLQRYAYDSELNGCKFFVYAGTRGNANNFLSEQECFAECGRGPQSSPCALGYPALAADGQSWLFCSSENSNICPFNYYCHIGVKKETTVCCLRTSPTSVSGFSVCQLPLQPGNGASFLSRWYFDSQSSTCKSFTYTGTGGNENNFVQLSDCRRICPGKLYISILLILEYDNACPAGTPPIDFQSGQVAFCSASNGFCSPGYWCHVGFDERSSVCCPFASDDPCSLPKSEGTGSLHIPRFFFNQTSRQCETFAYSGRKGNQNNFVTMQECEASCPVLENPCSEGMPLINRRSNTAVFCNSNEDGACPENYWCHLGATAAMTLCCPGDSDPCLLPQSRGNGNSVLSRWYYNTDTKMCLSFTYTGSGGNQNNFETIEACRSRCPEFQNPCTTGPPHINLNGHITRCGATTPTICPSSYWCHIGADLESSVCCPGGKSNKQRCAVLKMLYFLLAFCISATNPCELPVEQGSGQASLLRYGYIQETQTCRSFLYSGLHGNENNFMTLQECEQRCPGNDKLYIYMKLFFRNPCINGNPARDEQDNIVLCSVADMDDCPEGYWCHVGGDEQSTLCCPYENASCLMPLQVGEGVLMLPRFYFNSQTKQCLPFTYSGLGGNQNNFLSRGDCENSCPVFQNPCRQGEPATSASGQYILCTATGVDLCPANYWCHVGDSNSNSVCCPAADNPCVLPAETGTGQSVLVRWYFDRHARRCNRFVYTGSGGNENNFLAKQDCMARCPEFRNPCPIGDPSRSEKGTIVHCGDGTTGCPIGYWCHYGADAETTVCCQGAGDRCLLPMLPGVGAEKLKRWYFNQNSRQCLEFTYTGRGGNQNNFLTEEQCIQECPVFLNPCPRDSGSNVDVIYCSAQNRNTCPVGYWCHVGITVETSVCCEGDPCNLQLSKGIAVGTASTPRWYFDQHDRICKRFLYTGRGGNANNFLTRTECQQKCPETNPCQLPLSVGVGPANLDRWYFNSISGQCRPFTYAEFMNPCADGQPLAEVNVDHYCHIGAKAETSVCCPTNGSVCELRLNVGIGNLNLQRWHYDPTDGRCKLFTYTGIGGNANNFVTEQQCLSRCRGSHRRTEVKKHLLPFSHVQRKKVVTLCGQGEPYRNDGDVVHCVTAASCPLNFFCYSPASSQLNICCPILKNENPCMQPLISGRGSAKLARWYYNPASRTCQPFVYSGEGGSENNFESLADCESSCQSEQHDRFCAFGSRAHSDAYGEPMRCSRVGVLTKLTCPVGHYCRVGANSATGFCCPLLADPCQLPVLIGEGSLTVQRWYYDISVRHCKPFIYKGYQGNENNFLTYAECVRTCKHAKWSWNFSNSKWPLVEEVYPSIMLPSVVDGFPCAHGEPLITASGQLKECNNNNNDNNNNHSNTSNSFNALTTFPLCPSSYICTAVAETSLCCPKPEAFCSQPIDEGTSTCADAGRQRGIRFAYVSTLRRCVSFQFSGCGGNLNNFRSEHHCLTHCLLAFNNIQPSD